MSSLRKHALRSVAVRRDGGVANDRLGGLRPVPIERPRLPEPPEPPAKPKHGQLVAELRRLREKGLHELRSLATSALAEAALAAGEAVTPEEAAEPAAQEALLRRAVSQVGDGPLGTAAAYSFGLTPELRGKPSAVGRLAAAQVYVQDPESFRNSNERTVISETAEEILRLVYARRMREARVLMEKRHPADTHLAVQWVERFEAYYSLYTPISGLAADLQAARDTLLYDRVEPPWWAERGEGRPWDPVFQAEGYIRFALFHYASFLLKLKQFKIRHGGMWLLATQEREYAVSNAVYSIQWNNCMNERDDSWLRGVLCQAEGEELHPFLSAVSETDVGRETHREYQEWFRACACMSLPIADGWQLPDDAAGATNLLYTKEERTNISGVLDLREPQIAGDCQVHATIQACGEYIRHIDDDWERVLDWWRMAN